MNNLSYEQNNISYNDVVLPQDKVLDLTLTRHVGNVRCISKDVVRQEIIFPIVYYATQENMKNAIANNLKSAREEYPDGKLYHYEVKVAGMENAIGICTCAFELEFVNE